MVNTANIKISLVIPVYNEEDYIENYLNSLAEQTVFPYEVVFVNNCCTDSTISKIYNFARKNRKMNIKIIDQPKKGIKYARETGWLRAKGNIIAFNDADIELPKNWIELVCEIFNVENVKALTGPFYFKGLPIYLAFLIDILNILRVKFEPVFLGYRLCLGGNSIFLKDTLQIVDGYLSDEYITTDDIYISKKLRSYRIPVRYEPKLYVYESIRKYENTGVMGFLKSLVVNIFPKFYIEKGSE